VRQPLPRTAGAEDASTGNEQINDALGTERSRFITDYLMSKGVEHYQRTRIIGLRLSIVVNSANMLRGGEMSGIDRPLAREFFLLAKEILGKVALCRHLFLTLHHSSVAEAHKRVGAGGDSPRRVGPRSIGRVLYKKGV